MENSPIKATLKFIKEQYNKRKIINDETIREMHGKIFDLLKEIRNNLDNINNNVEIIINIEKNITFLKTIEKYNSNINLLHIYHCDKKRETPIIDMNELGLNELLNIMIRIMDGLDNTSCDDLDKMELSEYSSDTDNDLYDTMDKFMKNISVYIEMIDRAIRLFSFYGQKTK